MNFSNALIEKLKEAKGLKTDAEVAEMLPEMNKGNLSKIRKGLDNRHLNENQALFIANECGLNPEWVLVNLAAETAKADEAKSIWANLAKKITKSVTAGLLALTVIFAGLDDNRADSPVFS